ncbi:MAG: peptide ABC transporter substrate-binding protein [Woeseiaceae bacterium]|nr:peptide ABC transporter substrate-binding protein [Woeseiaceae bacterium]NIP20636.1 peptide ABC transporter substrate-binding protein [Woeseiaceae bacterium]NIS89429.1 peptide ABC transporter substrate-binding protein [Woeseiaceae bacterium]
MSRLRALVYALLFTLAAFVIWQYHDGGDGDEPARSVLHRGLVTDPESVDPHKARSTQAGDVLRDIGEGLLGYSPTGELVPGAASGWAVSDDGLTFTFTIRENARWSNGDPVTAGHFVYSLRRLVDPATAAFYASLVADIVNARAIIAGELPPEDLGVAAPDERTLVIRVERSTPYLLSLMTLPSTFPVHPGAIAEHGEEFTRPGNLLSNGAYKLDSWVPGSVLSLSRNEHYWNNAATAIDEVRHHVLIQQMTELNRYRAGELHITGTVPPDSFAQVREEYGDELHIAPYLGIYYYGFNLTRPPFKDNPKLREALSLAIDRDKLVETITARGEAPAYSWVPPGVDNYEPRRLGYADQGQEIRDTRARRLMAEAGFGPENPLEIELRYNTSDTNRRIALAIQSMWQDVLGVETRLINEEFQVLLENMRAAEVTQVFRSSWIGDYNDAHTFLSIMESGNPSNMPRYSNEEFDSLMQSAAAQTDPGLRRSYLEEAERVLLSDHAVIPIYFIVSKHLVSPQVRGWGDNVLDYHYSQHLSLAPADAAP